MNTNPIIKDYFVIKLGNYYVIEDIARWRQFTRLPDFLSARPADIHDNMLFERYEDALNYVNNVNKWNDILRIYVVGHEDEEQLCISSVRSLDYGEGLPILVYPDNVGSNGWKVQYGGDGL